MSNTPEIKLQLQEWRGYSAYEVAVQNGFDGTQKEWLESLKGGELQLTVNNVGVDADGNILLTAENIKMVRDGLYTIGDEINRLKEDKLDADDIANTLESTDASKVLSAVQGNVLRKAVLTKAELFMAELTIPASGWSGNGPYVQTIAVDGVTADCGVILTDYPDGGANETAFADCAIKLVGRDDGVVGIRAEMVPETDFKANLLVLFPGVKE